MLLRVVRIPLFRRGPAGRGLGTLAVIVGLGGAGSAQETPALALRPQLAEGSIVLELVASKGVTYRVETAGELSRWDPLVTLRGTGSNQLTTVAPPEASARYYRAVVDPNPDSLTGDHLQTSDGNLVIHPVNHASFVLQWPGGMIYNDPVGGASRYAGMPRAALILVSHDHGDHFEASTINAVKQDGTLVIAPAAVYSRLTAALKAVTIPLSNGAQTNVLGVTVEAIPAYNANHPKGVGNGYVLTLGGRRIYISGDTGNIPEMRSLTDINVAFVCMNVPFTMAIPEAVSAVRAFRPAVVYPYHFRNQDGSPANLVTFQRGVSPDLPIEVRRRTWY